MKRITLCGALVMALVLSTLCGCGKNENVVTDSVSGLASVSTAASDSKTSQKEESEEVSEEETVASTEEGDSSDSSTEASTSTQESQEAEESTGDTDLVLNADGSVNYLYYYSSVLTRVHYALTNVRGDLDYEYNEEWIMNSAQFGTVNSNLEFYGYCLKDISGDGIPELMLSDKMGGIIFNLYTLVDYEPYLVFDGYYRNKYFYLGDNKIKMFTSANAMREIMGIYELSQNGQELVALDYYFTWENEADPPQREIYHNTSGEFDKEKSELVDDEVYLLAWCEYEAQITPMEVTPYKNKTIEIAYEEDNPGKTVAEYYEADTSEYTYTVTIYDNNGMSDIELVSLEYVDITEMGDLNMSMTYIHKMEDIKGSEAISVKIAFGEIVPLYGIQYKDANGITRKFAIDVSGDDGSVYLWEF